jgi:hypothetical protein
MRKLLRVLYDLLYGPAKLIQKLVRSAATAFGVPINRSLQFFQGRGVDLD